MVICAGQFAATSPGDITPDGLNVLQPRTNLAGKVAGVHDRPSGGCVQDDHRMHQHGLLGVGYPAQVPPREDGRAAPAWR